MKRIVKECYMTIVTRDFMTLYALTAKLTKNPAVDKELYDKILVLSFLSAASVYREDYSVSLHKSYNHFKKMCKSINFTPVSYGSFRDIIINSTSTSTHKGGMLHIDNIRTAHVTTKYYDRYAYHDGSHRGMFLWSSYDESPSAKHLSWGPDNMRWEIPQP